MIIPWNNKLMMLELSDYAWFEFCVVIIYSAMRWKTRQNFGSFIGPVLEFYLVISPQLLIPLNFDGYLDD